MAEQVMVVPFSQSSWNELLLLSLRR